MKNVNYKIEDYNNLTPKKLLNLILKKNTKKEDNNIDNNVDNNVDKKNESDLILKKNENISENDNIFNLEISEIGQYSITRPNIMLKIINLINKYINIKNCIITDGTGGNGGDTINYALHCKFVNCIEIEKTNINILKTNINLYNINNVKLFHGNYLEYINILEQDIISLDPPWGGPSYFKQSNVKLCLDNLDISIITNYLFKKCKILILKVPFNFDFVNYFKNNNEWKLRIMNDGKITIIFHFK